MSILETETVLIVYILYCLHTNTFDYICMEIMSDLGVGMNTKGSRISQSV
jgi:hypothetical protein